MINKILSFILTIIIISNFCNITAYAISKPTIISDTAVLMDAKTGQILYEKQMDKIKYPASITKIATIYLSTLGTNDSDVIAVKKEDSLLEQSVTHIALIEDENVTLKDMQYAAMLMSANDACNVIARHIGGTTEAFVDKMNEFAQSVGATNTNFTNPHGLPNESHFTTAHDMALITREAIKSEKFCEIFKTTAYEMCATNKQPARPFACQDYMLKSNAAEYYQGIIGGKLGWTEEAHHTKVTVAKRNNRTLISVVMDSTSKDSKYEDTKKLLDYGFDNFTDYTISPQDVPYLNIDAMDGVNKIGTYDIYLSAPTKILLHKSVNPSDIIYKMPEITQLNQSEESSYKPTAQIVLPEYADDVMYCQSMLLNLKLLYTPSMIMAEEQPLKNQILWVTIESGKVLGIAFGITFGIIAVILLILFIRRSIILYKRKKHKKRLEKKRQQLVQTGAHKPLNTMGGNLPRQQNSNLNRNHHNIAKRQNTVKNVDFKQDRRNIPRNK